MTEYSYPARRERRPLSDKERREAITRILSGIGTAINEVVANPADRQTFQPPEIPRQPGTHLEEYADGTVLKTYEGPHTFKLSDLAAYISRDPVANDMGPVLIRATGINAEGRYEPRRIYLTSQGMALGVATPEGKERIVKDIPLTEDSLNESPPIVIGQPWTSPAGKNVGRIDSVTVPYTDAYSPSGNIIQKPSPLIDAKNILEKYE